ncbi:TlpA family protein disulfide reductase [Candidatus Woesearchaeota archaeon]|nr:TlpA family protein disulfide reductase [Candidatus Woesearchaeota archaeon]
MKKTIIFMSVIALLVVGVFLTGCTAGKTPDSSGTNNPVAEINSLGKSPDFTATTITGETVSTKSYLASSKPTIVYFMASWCPTCAKNWPSLNQIYSDYKDEINLVAISIDPTDTQEVLSKLAKEKGLIFPIVPGNPQVMVDFGVKGQATTVGVDVQGNIRFIKSGEFSLEEYRSMVGELL